MSTKACHPSRGHMNTKEDFWSRVAKTDESSDDCWEWMATKFSETGYGDIRFQGTRTSAHRLSYRLTYGAIPDGLFVLHKCDNRGCVRPSHLFLGTHSDNMSDMVKKGRGYGGFRVHPQPKPKRGSDRWNAKLTESSVREIRALRATESTPYLELSRRFGVTVSAIASIIQRRSWTHCEVEKSEARP